MAQRGCAMVQLHPITQLGWAPPAATTTLPCTESQVDWINYFLIKVLTQLDYAVKPHCIILIWENYG